MSDGYQTEGLIYASSQLHWMGDGTGKRLNVAPDANTAGTV